MDIVSILFRSVLIGFIVAAPVGPVAAMLIRRTLHSGARVGFSAGLGAAMADLIFAAIAVLGLASVSDFLFRHERELAFVGGVVLLVVGAISLKRNQSKKADPSLSLVDTQEEREDEKRFKKKPWIMYATKSFFVALALTLTNPATIVGMGAAISGAGLSSQMQSLDHHILILAGIFSGALIWWASLTYFVKWSGRRLSKSWIFKVQRMTAVLILLSGLFCLARALTLSYST